LTRFRDIRWYTYGTWAVELMTGGERVWLGTFYSTKEATRRLHLN
jgi:hypothetical protein